MNISASVLRSVVGNYIEDAFQFNIINHGAIQDLEIQYKNGYTWTTLKTIQDVESETEYTFTSTEISTLYGAYTTTDVVNMQFILRSYRNSRQTPITPVSVYTKNLFIKPYVFYWDSPYFTFEDTNAVTTALTGNDNILIRDYSNIYYEIPSNRKPTAIKSAYIDYYLFKNSNGEYTQVYDYPGTIYGPVCYNYGQDYLEVVAVDSRGFSVVQSKSPTKLINDYYAPSGYVQFERIDSVGEGGKIDLYIYYWDGNFAGGSDASKDNTIKSVYYRTRTSNGSFGNWVDITSSMTISNGTASASDLRIYHNGNNFDVGTSYVVEIKATDGISSQDFNEISGITATLSDGTVLDSYYKTSGGDYKIGINKLVDKNGSTLQVNGDVSLTDRLNLSSNGYKTYSSAGYTTDAYGNFHHQQATAGDNWQLYDNAGNVKGQFFFETGKAYLNNRQVSTNSYIVASIGTGVTVDAEYKSVDFDASYYGGNAGDFTLSNGKIYIGNDVSKIRVSATIFCEGIQSSWLGYAWLFLRKNGTDFANYIVSGVPQYYQSASFSPKIIDVSSGDYIELLVNNSSYQSGSYSIRAGYNQTWIMIERVE